MKKYRLRACYLLLLLIVCANAATPPRVPSPPPPSPGPPSPPSPSVMWATSARDCQDKIGSRNRRGAAQNLLGPPNERRLAVVTSGLCQPALSLTWASPVKTKCFVEAYFGSSEPESYQPKVKEIANITLLLFNRGSIRPSIDAIDVVVSEPPAPAAPPPPPPPPPPPKTSNITSKASARPIVLPSGVNAILMPIFRAATASTAELKLDCPGFNRWRLRLHNSMPSVPWFQEATVLGVRVTVKGPGASISGSGVTYLGVAALGLEMAS